MRAYTANELQEIVERAYQMGFDDGRNRRGTGPSPPRLFEIHNHPVDHRDSSLKSFGTPPPRRAG